MKKVSRYEIREFIGQSYSKSLSPKLRTRERATKLVKRLRKQGREVFAAKMAIAA